MSPLGRAEHHFFIPRVLDERLAGHTFPADLADRHAILKNWVLALRTGKLDASKEVSLHGDFLGDVFGRALGYRTVTTSGAGGWEVSAEKTMGGGGKSADGALGFFSAGAPGTVIAPIELKGAKQDLDLAMGRALTPVQQAWDYANHSPAAAGSSSRITGKRASTARRAPPIPTSCSSWKSWRTWRRSSASISCSVASTCCRRPCRSLVLRG